MDLKQLLSADNRFLICYLGNINQRKKFSGWYREKVSLRNRHEFYLLTQGGGQFVVDGVSYEVNAGDLVYIPGKVGIAYNFFPADPQTEYLALNLSCAVASHSSEIWQYDEAHSYHAQPLADPDEDAWAFAENCAEFDLPTVSPTRNDRMLRDLLLRLNQLHKEADPTQIWAKKLLVQQFLYEVSTHRHQKSKEDMNTHRIYKLTNYIKNHYSEPLSLADLCEEVQLSASYVISLFKQYTNQPPVLYLNCVRIEAAKELLLESALPISEIAPLTGFPDAFYFSRKFKQLVGCTPRAYRNRTL